MAVEVDDVDCRPQLVIQSIDQVSERSRSQELDVDASIGMPLGRFEQRRGLGSRIEEGGVDRSAADEQHAQALLRPERRPVACRRDARHPTSDRDRPARVEPVSPPGLAKQLPGQCEDAWIVGLDRQRPRAVRRGREELREKLPRRTVAEARLEQRLTPLGQPRLDATRLGVVDLGGVGSWVNLKVPAQVRVVLARDRTLE